MDGLGEGLRTCGRNLEEKQELGVVLPLRNTRLGAKVNRSLGPKSCFREAGPEAQGGEVTLL